MNAEQKESDMIDGQKFILDLRPWIHPYLKLAYLWNLQLCVLIKFLF